MQNVQEQEFYDTGEFSRQLHVKPATPRRSLCVAGHYLGIKPKKLPNGRLLWPVGPTQRLLEGII